MSIVQMLFSPVGRIRRRDYWLYSILIAATFYVSLYVSQKVFRPGVSFREGLRHVFSPIDGYTYAYLSCMLAYYWPHICLGAKRWHDRNRAGYLAVASAAINLAYFAVTKVKLIPIGSVANSATIVLLGLFVVFFLWTFIECGCLDGTKGGNCFGSSPKGIDAQSDVF